MLTLCCHGQLDYGSTYEEIRLQKYSSRLKGKEKKINWRQEEDNYAVAQLSDYSMANILEVLAYLERLFSRAWQNTEEKLARALIAALLLNTRINTIWKDSSPRAAKSDGETMGRIMSLLGVICGQWADAPCLKESILSMSLLEAIVANCIGCAGRDLASLDADDLRHRILTVHLK